ncbi:hypothetical protein QNH14_04500 [Apirhabdus apintestini]|uniref:phage neck terminator protein n=1 Tax=Erwinia sp. HR93 TaxID=3094840 RepID=UPI002ADEE156|nr:hypothetical protein [Erwinia sp. HR93]MEA1064296.1 hypothetical protein [Erwinia sp. HR93]WPM85426.1 hypothetical protein QNH14_04500 [Enterobacteriaceae bacterium CA-0114]
MTNSSNAPGWLTPRNDDPAYDAELDKLIAGWITGVSGLSSQAVIPMRNEGQEPPKVENWCEYAAVFIGRDPNAVCTAQEEELVTLKRGETVSCRLWFWGPLGQRYAARFLDGVLVAQNQDELRALGFAFGGHGALIGVAKQINNQWVKRYDVTLRLYRTVAREYGVMSLTQAPVTFFTGE